MAVLRPILLAIGGAMLAAALVAAVAGAPLGCILWLAASGAMLVGGMLFERGRYKPATQGRPGPDWVATGERFADPQSGEEVTVFYRPSTGERRYVGR